MRRDERKLTKTTGINMPAMKMSKSPTPKHSGIWIVTVFRAETALINQKEGSAMARSARDSGDWSSFVGMNKEETIQMAKEAASHWIGEYQFLISEVSEVTPYIVKFTALPRPPTIPDVWKRMEERERERDAREEMMRLRAYEKAIEELKVPKRIPASELVDGPLPPT